MPKRYPLPKRLQAALSEKSYSRLRALNERWGLGNNYLLVVLPKHLDDYADPEALDRALADFVAEYGAPSSGRDKGR